MMERKLDKEATILYSNETESEVRRMKDKKIGTKISNNVFSCERCNDFADI